MNHKIVMDLNGVVKCKHCGGVSKSLTAECPGHPLTFEDRQAIRKGQKDYHSGRWWYAVDYSTNRSEA